MNITRSGNTATVTTTSPHGLVDGDAVKISGSSLAEYNGIFQISYVSATVFTIHVTAATSSAQLVALNQTTRNWTGMAAAPNGNIYAAVALGDIYMRTAGTGDFVALSQTPRDWYGMAAAPNGNIYASVNTVGDIYMQTAGSGAFAALGQTARAWSGMAAAPNGNIYAAVSAGDIYMQTAGAGAFVALGQTSRTWFGMAAAPNGNIYAADEGGDIYMQTAGVGAFVALSQTVRNWGVMAAAPNGNVYAAEGLGDLYIQTAGTGAFVAFGQTSRDWFGMTAAVNGDVYMAVHGGDIYMLDGIGSATGLRMYPYTESYYKLTKYARCGDRDLYLHESDGHIYEGLSTLYQDAGIPISMFVRTTRIDANSSKIKVMNRIGVIADDVDSIAMMRWSDDDKTTDSAYRIIDLNVKEPMLRKCGAFQRRSIEFKHVGNKPLDITDVEINGGP